MKKLMYKLIFNVTGTCQNGKERRVQKPVYIDPYNTTHEERIQRGTEILKSLHYYNIQYGSTVVTELIFA